MLNLSNYPDCYSTEEIVFFSLMELDEIDPPFSEVEAFDYINGRVFDATWPEDEIPW